MSDLCCFDGCRVSLAAKPLFVLGVTQAKTLGHHGKKRCRGVFRFHPSFTSFLQFTSSNSDNTFLHETSLDFLTTKRFHHFAIGQANSSHVFIQEMPQSRELLVSNPRVKWKLKASALCWHSCGLAHYGGDFTQDYLIKSSRCLKDSRHYSTSAGDIILTNFWKYIQVYTALFHPS